MKWRDERVRHRCRPPSIKRYWGPQSGLRVTVIALSPQIRCLVLPLMNKQGSYDSGTIRSRSGRASVGGTITSATSAVGVGFETASFVSDEQSIHPLTRLRMQLQMTLRRHLPNSLQCTARVGRSHTCRSNVLCFVHKLQITANAALRR